MTWYNIVILDIFSILAMLSMVYLDIKYRWSGGGLVFSIITFVVWFLWKTILISGE